MKKIYLMQRITQMTEIEVRDGETDEEAFERTCEEDGLEWTSAITWAESQWVEDEFNNVIPSPWWDI